jgi:hypothetical protein
MIRKVLDLRESGYIRFAKEFLFGRVRKKRLDEAAGPGDPERGIFPARERKVWAGVSEDTRLSWLYDHCQDQARQGAGDPRVRKDARKGFGSGFFRTCALKLHYLRWVLFDIGKDTYFMYQGIFDTEFDKYTDDAVALFTKSGISTTFENLEGFPEDWKTNVPGFIKFVRDHQCPSFLEYGEYPYVTADEIKKALRLKKAFSEMLDEMQ